LKRLLAASQAFAFAQLGQGPSDLWWNPAEPGWGIDIVSGTTGMSANCSLTGFGLFTGCTVSLRLAAAL